MGNNEINSLSIQIVINLGLIVERIIFLSIGPNFRPIERKIIRSRLILL